MTSLLCTAASIRLSQGTNQMQPPVYGPWKTCFLLMMVGNLSRCFADWGIMKKRMPALMECGNTAARSLPGFTRSDFHGADVFLNLLCLLATPARHSGLEAAGRSVPRSGAVSPSGTRRPAGSSAKAPPHDCGPAQRGRKTSAYVLSSSAASVIGIWPEPMRRYNSAIVALISSLSTS